MHFAYSYSFELEPFDYVQAVVTVLLGLGVVVWVGWVTVRAMRRRRLAESVCGRCGYIVTGLPSLVCPECGSYLWQAGVRRFTQRPWLPLIAVVVWTTACVAVMGPVVVASFDDDRWLPLLEHRSDDGELVRTKLILEPAERSVGIRVRDACRRVTWRRQVLSSAHWIEFSPSDAPAAVLHVDVGRGQWRYAAANGASQSGEKLTRDVVNAWLADCSWIAQDERTAVAAAAVLDCFEATRAAGEPCPSGAAYLSIGSGSSSRPHWSGVLGVSVICSVLWVAGALGVLRLVRGRRWRD